MAYSTGDPVETKGGGRGFVVRNPTGAKGNKPGNPYVGVKHFGTPHAQPATDHVPNEVTPIPESDLTDAERVYRHEHLGST
jgi:hypothetical protein